MKMGKIVDILFGSVAIYIFTVNFVPWSIERYQDYTIKTQVNQFVKKWNSFS